MAEWEAQVWALKRQKPKLGIVWAKRQGIAHFPAGKKANGRE